MKFTPFSPALLAQRLATRPQPKLDADLPVLAAQDDILQAIRQHAVVIISGETGSGKTTQLPQLCLLLDRGLSAMIACTQPRRVAARSVAQRLAQELGCQLGNQVGYQVRFHDQVSERTLIKVMTEGILLAEIASDPELRRYDTIILDEVHERSLNMDFLLGYLKRLLPQRPDLKLVLTSATLEAERLAQHFNQAPIITVSGRTWPVEIRWRPITSREEREEPDEDRDTTTLLKAVDELIALPGQGDILVFLPGERDIRRMAEALRKHPPPHTEILALYARQSVAEQERVFHLAPERRIVLATNVAETSLTVPGVRYVIDTGLARLNRYSLRTKLTQLRIEKISQAAARQRAGRCGRVAAGVCIRLYSEQDYAGRLPFTPPEILRTSLASVILRLTMLNLGSLDELPLLDKPSLRAIEDGYRLLHALGAVDDQRGLTPLGHDLAPLPLDPRLGRMVLAARDKGCLQEILILVAALSIQDPRERPFQERKKAEAHHASLVREGSEFLALLDIWSALQETMRHKKSNRQLATHCRQQFLSLRRVREWRDVHGQLCVWIAERGWIVNATPALPETLHRALLEGLLDQIGQWDREAHQYLGPRGIRFTVAGGTRNPKQRPRWIMAGEIAETERIQARLIAPILPEWVESAALHQVQRSYGDPHWDADGEQINAYETVTFYGLTLVSRRQVRYGPIAPHEARHLFIHHGLVAGELRQPPDFVHQNQQLIDEALDLEHKRRRQGFLIDEADLVAFYEDQFPPDVWSAQRLQRWLATRQPQSPDPLRMTKVFLLRHRVADVPITLYPDHWPWADHDWPLSYRFEPGHALDGVTLTLPREALPLFDQAPIDWLVAGLIREKITACFKLLPASQRRKLVPLPEAVTAFLERHTPSQGPFFSQLNVFVQQRTGQSPPPDLAQQLPDYLAMRLVLTDDQGHEWLSSRNFSLLRQRWSVALQQAEVTVTTPDWVRTGLTQWDFERWPEPQSITRSGITLTVYPALLARKAGVDMIALESFEEAVALSHEGVRRLARLGLATLLSKGANAVPGLLPLLPHFQRVQTEANAADLFERLVEIHLRQWLPDDAPLPQCQAEFQRQLQSLKAQWRDALIQHIALWRSLLQQHHDIGERLHQLERQKDLQSTLAFVNRHRQQLLEQALNPVLAHPQRQQIPRYLQAIMLRLEKLPRDPSTDARKFSDWQTLQRRWQQTLSQRGTNRALEQFGWLLEELHCALFAQSLPIPHPVSRQRLEKFWQSHCENA